MLLGGSGKGTAGANSRHREGQRGGNGAILAWHYARRLVRAETKVGCGQRRPQGTTAGSGIRCWSASVPSPGPEQGPSLLDAERLDSTSVAAPGARELTPRWATAVGVRVEGDRDTTAVNASTIALALKTRDACGDGGPREARRRLSMSRRAPPEAAALPRRSQQRAPNSPKEAGCAATPAGWTAAHWTSHLLARGREPGAESCMAVISAACSGPDHRAECVDDGGSRAYPPTPCWVPPSTAVSTAVWRRWGIRPRTASCRRSSRRCPAAASHDG